MFVDKSGILGRECRGTGGQVNKARLFPPFSPFPLSLRLSCYLVRLALAYLCIVLLALGFAEDPLPLLLFCPTAFVSS